MALPKEPRQKMINIMYLVLTALLAINISAEILNAFKTIDESLIKTNTAVNASSTQILKSLGELRTGPTADRANIWYPKAEKVTQEAAKAYAFIDNLRKELIAASSSGGKLKEDDQNATTRILVKEGKGKELYKILEEYKKNVLGADSAIAAEFANNFQVELTAPKSQTSKKKTWEEAYFYMSPTVGALSILSKFQNDIKTSENNVVAFCHKKVGEVKIVFDSYAAIIGTSSNYVMPGQTLTINAGVGAYSKASAPTISIGGGSAPLGPEGFATRDITAGGPGTYSVPVTISYFDQTTGKQEQVSKNVEYTVGSPGGASVGLDKMNVLYIGVDNPVSIASSTGWDKTKVSISGGGGSLNAAGGGNGKFNARVNSVTDDCTITVTSDGKPSLFKFRVRTIPEAQAYVGGQPSGASVTAGAFKAQGGVQAGIKNFPFELNYEVVSYTFTCDTDDDIVSIPAQGASFNGAVRNAITTHVKPERMVTIENIRVKGPDGRTTNAPALVYYIR
jgi:gliding motility-associated protein GldM